MTATDRQERFQALLEAHKRILWKIAHAYCKNPSDRPDVVQEIVVQLWRSFDRYDERTKFSTWMYRVALNVAISCYRREVRRTRHIVPAEDSILEIAALEPDSDDLDENLQLLHAFIAQLDELDRALILLYLDGNPHETIAEILGISTTNVGTKVGRIKQKLRRAFESEGKT